MKIEERNKKQLFDKNSIAKNIIVLAQTCILQHPHKFTGTPPPPLPDIILLKELLVHHHQVYTIVGVMDHSH